jgi:hypothetical protein
MSKPWKGPKRLFKGGAARRSRYRDSPEECGICGAPAGGPDDGHVFRKLYAPSLDEAVRGAIESGDLDEIRRLHGGPLFSMMTVCAACLERGNSDPEWARSITDQMAEAGAT